uniref:Uncharacterized protein n=1 Tax=Romanomermis culicivorax TaxID=13658 RepID=A0A915HLV6_ROMCU
MLASIAAKAVADKRRTVRSYRDERICQKRRYKYQYCKLAWERSEKRQNFFDEGLMNRKRPENETVTISQEFLILKFQPETKVEHSSAFESNHTQNSNGSLLKVHMTLIDRLMESIDRLRTVSINAWEPGAIVRNVARFAGNLINKLPPFLSASHLSAQDCRAAKNDEKLLVCSLPENLHENVVLSRISTSLEILRQMENYVNIKAHRREKEYFEMQHNRNPSRSSFRIRFQRFHD